MFLAVGANLPASKIFSNSLSSIFVLYNSTLNFVAFVTNAVPVLSNISPLAASKVVSLVNLVLDSSLYSEPFTICRLKSCIKIIIPNKYTIAVKTLYLKLEFSSSLFCLSYLTFFIFFS